MLQALQKLGFAQKKTPDGFFLQKNQTHPVHQKLCCHKLYCQNTGTVARFLPALLLHLTGKFTIIPDTQMCRRPMQELFLAFQQVGIEIHSDDAQNRLPWVIFGPQQPNHFDLYIKSNISSQFVSCLLFFLAAFPQKSSITLLHRTVSTPYINMSIEVLKQFGKNIEFNKNIIHIGSEPLQAPLIPVQIEKDWSSAAFLIAHNLIRRQKIQLNGLSYPSWQGDAVFLKFIQKMGAKIQLRPNILVEPASNMRGIKANLSLCPDLAPVLFVMAPFLKSPSLFTGLQGLRFKESNRLNALCRGLLKAGFTVHRQQNSIRIFPSVGQRCSIDCYNDHRIAMAFGLLPQGLKLNQPAAVQKSFPNYFEEIKKILF